MNIPRKGKLDALCIDEGIESPDIGSCISSTEANNAGLFVPRWRVVTLEPSVSGR